MLMIARKLCILAFVFWLAPCLSASSFPRQFDHVLAVYSAIYLPEIDWRLLKAQCYQESLLDPVAVSPVGAAGLCQFMPATWRDMQSQLGIRTGPFNPVSNVRAAAYYMRGLRRGWSSQRPEVDRHNLALASYNAGFGNILKAQRKCDGARLYPAIIQCLPAVTGHHSQETMTYVERIRRWYGEMQNAEE